MIFRLSARAKTCLVCAAHVGECKREADVKLVARLWQFVVEAKLVWPQHVPK